VTDDHAIPDEPQCSEAAGKPHVLHVSKKSGTGSFQGLLKTARLRNNKYHQHLLLIFQKKEPSSSNQTKEKNGIWVKGAN